MKKVLIIANLFYASPRIPGIAKYFLEFGWKPTILTVPMRENFYYRLGVSSEFKEKVRIIETPYQGDIFWFWRKLFKFFGFKTNESILNQLKEKMGITSKRSIIDCIFYLYQTVFCYPDEEKKWKKPALDIADKLLKKEKFDAFISSSSPVTVHIVAKELKRRYRIPWIADLRDLWTQNHYYPYSRIRKFFEQKLELRTLKKADALVTVSLPWANKLKKMHKKDKTYIVTNGFDLEENNRLSVNLTNKFTITYTGTIYTDKQNPSKFFQALKKLIERKEIDPGDIKVRFYGHKKKWLDKEIENYQLSDIVKQYGVISRNMSLQKQKESQLLLLLNWEDPEEKGVIPGKIFEYFVAKRPILATGGFGSDMVEKLLNKTKAGVYCKEIEDIKENLKKFYSEYKQKKVIDFTGEWQEIKKYSYRKSAEKFVQILNLITQHEK